MILVLRHPRPAVRFQRIGWAESLTRAWHRCAFPRLFSRGFRVWSPLREPPTFINVARGRPSIGIGQW